jgi:hypothetical protein
MAVLIESLLTALKGQRSHLQAGEELTPNNPLRNGYGSQDSLQGEEFKTTEQR